MEQSAWRTAIGAAMPAALREGAQHLSVGTGETVFRAGSRPRKIYWVLDGEVRLVRRSRNGAEIVLQRASTGFIAEASLESPRYHCDAVAAAKSRLVAFPIERFRQALADDDKFRAFWMHRLAREVRALRSQSERLALRSAAERIEHYIEAEGHEGRLELSRSRKAWAAELGLTHEALYRTLAEMQRLGTLMAGEKDGKLVLTMKRAS
jgi:CRP-like cAMP-binding protein